MTDVSRNLRLAYVSYGKSSDSMMASGVPYYLRRGFASVTRVEVSDVSSRPTRIVRFLLKGLSFRPGRADWERNYRHGRILPWTRSWLRSRRLAAHAPDVDAVLHVRTWYSPIGVPYASFIDATVAMVRGYDDTWALSDRQYEAEIKVEGEFYRQALVVYTASRAASVSLVKDYGVEPARILQVGAGTTLPGLDELSDERIVGRFARPNILFVGKDPVRKGLLELLQAFPLIRKVLPGVTLTVVGPESALSGLPADGVTWCGLVNDKMTMRELYADATLFVLPAHRESYGLVVPEAMSYGLPCIVSKTGELPHIVADRTDGIVLDEISADAITSAVCLILEDEENYARLARAAYARSGDFDWTRIAQTMTDDLAARLHH